MSGSAHRCTDPAVFSGFSVQFGSSETVAVDSNRYIEHLLRRAGFGARPDELDFYSGLSISEAVQALVHYERVPDTVDTFIGKPGYAGITPRGPFTPRSNI